MSTKSALDLLRLSYANSDTESESDSDLPTAIAYNNTQNDAALPFVIEVDVHPASEFTPEPKLITKKFLKRHGKRLPERKPILKDCELVGE